MPYLILIFGILVALFALYRFMVKANIEQVRFLFLVIFAVLYSGVLLFFALTGRVVISIGLLVFLVPFIVSHFRAKLRAKKDDNEPKN